MKTINEAIADAKKVILIKKLPFATIWKTGKLYGFNFDKKPMGFSVNEHGIKGTVVGIINN